MMRVNPDEFELRLEALIIKLILSGDSEIIQRLERIEHNQRIIMATLEERFNAVSAKLDEASAEILAEIATLRSQPLTPEQEAALANIETKANALGDIAPPIA